MSNSEQSSHIRELTKQIAGTDRALTKTQAELAKAERFIRNLSLDIAELRQENRELSAALHSAGIRIPEK